MLYRKLLYNEGNLEPLDIYHSAEARFSPNFSSSNVRSNESSLHRMLGVMRVHCIRTTPTFSILMPEETEQGSSTVPQHASSEAQ